MMTLMLLKINSVSPYTLEVVRLSTTMTTSPMAIQTPLLTRSEDSQKLTRTGIAESLEVSCE